MKHLRVFVLSTVERDRTMSPEVKIEKKKTMGFAKIFGSSFFLKEVSEEIKLHSKAH